MRDCGALTKLNDAKNRLETEIIRMKFLVKHLKSYGEETRALYRHGEVIRLTEILELLD